MGRNTKSLNNKDLTFTVSTDGTVKQTNDKISSIEAQIKELTSLIRNNEVSAINSGSFKDPNVKGGRITQAFAIIAVIMGILFLIALNRGLMKDLKK